MGKESGVKEKELATMKLRYKGEYYIITKPTRENGEYTCRAWNYRTGREVTCRDTLRGIAFAYFNGRKRSNETH